MQPETVSEALEIAEKDACDHVDSFIEERLDTSVKDGDYDEVLEKAVFES